MTTADATSSAADLIPAIRSKEVSARELLETYLERIDRLDRIDRAIRVAGLLGEVVGGYQVPPGFQ
jgi:Asp-tRNA(Asn)/Glu-tRNA(Gln) amidotransferase A subunit family amidase